MLTTLLCVLVLASPQASSELTLHAPASVDMCASVWTPVIPLQVARPEKLEGAVKWSVVSSPPGVRIAIVPGENDAAKVYLRGFCSGPEPDSKLVVSAAIGDKKAEAPITLTRGQARVLLVDDDDSENNLPSPTSTLSESDKLYRRLLLEGDGLRSLAFDTAIVPKYANGPTPDLLQKYDAVVWYTAAEYGGNRDNTAVMSNVDLDNLNAFLGKGKCVVLFSPGLVNNYQGYVKVARGNEEQWSKVGHPFLSGPMGLKGARGLIHRFNEVDVQAVDGAKFHLAKGKPVETQISPVNPATAKTLFMASLNPDGAGVRPVPCASASVTEHGSVVYVGFSFEDISDNVEDAFRVTMTPAVGWGAAIPANAIVLGPAGGPQPQTTLAPPPANQPGSPRTVRPAQPKVEQPAPGKERREPVEAGDDGSNAPLAPQPGDDARFRRLSEIARALRDPNSDAVALVTEAVRLCGFAIWKEDRTKIAEPTGEPRLHLAITDVEIREYVAMYRAGHWVDLQDFIAALDDPCKRLGAQGSCGHYVNAILDYDSAVSSMSVHALTSFLTDLGASHGDRAGHNQWLDPIQTLLLVRVVTEEMAAPLHRYLTEHPVRPGSQGRLPGRGVRYASLVAFPPAAEEGGFWSFAEEAFVTLAPGTSGLLLEHLEEAIHGPSEALPNDLTPLKALGTANVLLSLGKFLATYAALKVDIDVEAPGQPLTRTLDSAPGEQRRLVAHVYIDPGEAAKWVNAHRMYFAGIGVELDMPKAGDLKHVETQWEIDESHTSTIGHLLQTPRGSRDISKVPTDEKGNARITVEGTPQNPEIDRETALPLEKSVKITVTPQAKPTEIGTDLLDAISGAMSVREGGIGFLKPVMETLYRMKWKGGRSFQLEVIDWKRGENVGELNIKIHEVGRQLLKYPKVQVFIDRTLEFVNTVMESTGAALPPKPSPDVLAHLPPLARQQTLDGYEQALARARKPEFKSSYPGTVKMDVADRLIETTRISPGGCGEEEEGHDRTRTETTTASISDTLEKNRQAARFSVKVDFDAKTATLEYPSRIPVAWQSKITPAVGEISQSSTTHMGLFDGLNPGAPALNSISVVIPLKMTEIPKGNAQNFYGVESIPITFGPRQEFKGTATVTYSITRRKPRK